MNEKKGPFGPDGLRHPPPDNRIDINILDSAMNVNKEIKKDAGINSWLAVPMSTIPHKWQCAPLGGLIIEALPGFARGERDDKGVIQMRMNNVDVRGRITLDNVIRVPTTSEEVEKYQLSPGDVVFNNTNSTELVGKSAYFEGFDESIVYSNHFTRIRTKKDLLDSKYLASWLVYQWQNRIFENICNRWIGQSAVNNEKLLSLKIPFPPLAEQKRIAAILNEQMEAAEKLRARLESQLNEIDRLPQALLRMAFSGEV
jgi:type I restriction enzyme S subunit